MLRSCLQKHLTSFLCPRRPTLAHSVASALLSHCLILSRFCSFTLSCPSLWEVCFGCRFPCGNYNNLFWHHQVSCSLLSPPPPLQLQSTNTMIQNHKSPLVVLAPSRLLQPFLRVQWVRSDLWVLVLGTPLWLCSLWTDLIIMCISLKYKQMLGYVQWCILDSDVQINTHEEGKTWGLKDVPSTSRK